MNREFARFFRSLLLPALIVSGGVAVGALVLALFKPLFDLGSHVSPSPAVAAPVTPRGRSSSPVPVDTWPMPTLTDSVPTSLVDVWSGGAWKDGSMSGYYRLLWVNYGFEHPYYELYAEWIAIDYDSHTIAIIRTIPLKETRGMWGLGEARVIENSENDLVVEVSGRVQDLGGEVDHTIRLGQPGQYSIQQRGEIIAPE